MTKQRAMILEIIRASREHMTAEMVFAEARERMPGIVRATVYNNLNALDAAGLIRRVQVAAGPDRFDKTVTDHIHLICDGCGRVMDAMEIGDLTPILTERYGVEVTHLELNAHCLCAFCRAKAVVRETLDGSTTKFNHKGETRNGTERQ